MAVGGTPVFLVFAGDLLGAFIGLIAISIHAKVFRSGFKDVLKYIISSLYSFAAVIATLFLKTIISFLILGQETF